MNTFRESPLHSRFMPHGFTANPGDNNMAAWRSAVALADLSFLGKTGFKGPAAAAWLAGRGIPVPQQYNTWGRLPGGGLIMRLAVSEFFIEDASDGTIASGVARELESMVAGVWPVLRQDAGIALAGDRAAELLAQTCSFNFADLGTDGRTVIMTSMAGVGVLVIHSNDLQKPCYRIWCDPTYAPYLWDTLAAIAGELGGGVVGAQAFVGQDAS